MPPQSPLGQQTDYPDTYSPELLFAISREESRSAIGLDRELPFSGVDIWNAWEMTWLAESGQPVVGAVEIRVPADSPSIVESKSLKLYLNSFAMSRFASAREVAGRIEQDLTAIAGAGIGLRMHLSPATEGAASSVLPGDCIDALATVCNRYDVDSALLQCDDDNEISEDLHSHILRSLCPVTGQPDTGSVHIFYEGPAICRASLLRYIVSYRQHNDFHEACVERMFLDIRERCRTRRLSIHARYQRRGGIDINPFRSDFESDPHNLRLWRQ